MQNSEKNFRISEFGIENALARIVRRRWPINTIENTAAEWGLSFGRAKGVVYAQASRCAINQIIHHKRGGLRLMIEVVLIMTGETLRGLILSEIRSLDDAAAKTLADARSLAVLESRLASLPLDGMGIGPGPVPSDGPALLA